MELTPDQIAAAQASGCTFIPASDEQVARLTMQRRIFTIDGHPHVATRNDGAVKETHGAVALLIAGGEAAPVQETTQEALAADAEAALAMAGETAAARGGAQVVRRGAAAAARPRAPWRNTKRGA